MPTEMLDQLQENKLQALEDSIGAYEADTAAGAGKEQAAALADFFVDEGIGLKQSFQHLWQYHWTMALAGKVPNHRQQGVRLRSLWERGCRLLKRYVATARANADLSGHEVA